jgi:hypothetical protein
MVKIGNIPVSIGGMKMMIEEKHHTQTYTSGTENKSTRNLPKQLSVYIYPESEKSQGYQRPGAQTHHSTHELDLLDLQMALLWSERTYVNKLSSSVIKDKPSPYCNMASLFENNQETVVRTDPVEEQLDFPAEASTFNAKFFCKDVLLDLQKSRHVRELTSTLETSSSQTQSEPESGLTLLTDQETWLEDAMHRHFIDSLLEIQKRQEQERIRATKERVLAGS